MKKKLIILSLFLSVTTLTLTSCKVNWFDKQYDAPWWAIAIPVTVFTVVTMLLCAKYISSREFICPKCNHKFHPKWWMAMFSLHIGSDRFFKCPHCGKKSFCPIARKKKDE